MSANTGNKKLGQLLIEAGHLNRSQLQTALEHQQNNGGKLGELLVKLGFIDENKLCEALAEKLQLPKLSLADIEIDPRFMDIFPAEIARRHSLIPIFKVGNVLTLAMSDPLNFVAIDEINYHTGLEVKRVISTKSEVEKAIDQFYSITDTVSRTMNRIEADESLSAADRILDVDTSEGISSDMPVIEMVNIIIAKAVERKASDIHLEPDENVFRVRYRVDGLMVEAATMPANIHNPVTSRIKVMSNMDVSEKRVPQDGRFMISYKKTQVDFRVSSLPTIFGEKIVIRILDKGNIILDLGKMGFSESVYKQWLDVVDRPEGLVLITGPTSSGKTSTLYAALNRLNKPEKNVVTVEDPVEYKMPFLNQVPINEKSGLTFAVALRSIVRQNPDILMVGEIRDLATAEISIRASLTGHLVLATLHTSDAPVAPGRLIDMGVEPYLVSTSVTAVLAQRLVRVICEKCSKEITPDQSLFDNILSHWNRPGVKFYKGSGCPRCSSTGYHGRTAIHELMVISPKIKELISNKASHIEIRRAAIETGMVSLLDDGIEKASRGITTIDEVLRVCHSEDGKLTQSEPQKDLQHADTIQV